ncbi:MAG: hypothetical protein AAGG79_07735 [Pseudomonadota bacterium]
MKIAALFLWLVVPLGVWGAVTMWGTAHVIVSYRFFDNGAVYDLQVARRYIDCTYFGWTGTRTVPAIDETCPWVRLFKADDQ